MHACPTITAPITLGPAAIRPVAVERVGESRADDPTERLAEMVQAIHRVERSVVDVLISLGSQSRSRELRRVIAVHVSETKEHVDRLAHMAILLRYGSDSALPTTGGPFDVETESAAPFVTTDVELLDAEIGIARRQVERAESIRVEVAGYGGVRALLDDGLAQQRARVIELESLRGALLERSV